MATAAPYFADPYIKHIHAILIVESDSLDAVYEDYILKLVGTYGLKALIDCGLIESCGVVNGRKLYKVL